MLDLRQTRVQALRLERASGQIVRGLYQEEANVYPACAQYGRSRIGHQEGRAHRDFIMNFSFNFDWGRQRLQTIGNSIFLV